MAYKMYLVLLVMASILFNSCTGLGDNQVAKGQERMKRNIYQFGKMIQCETKRWPTDYLGYGCWCGLGGKGTPVDETDQCCKEHDLCYKKAHRTDCFIGQAYTVVYNRKGCSGCDEKKNKKYEQTVCECDSVAVKCFKKAKFNDKYKRYSQTKCH